MSPLKIYVTSVVYDTDGVEGRIVWWVVARRVGLLAFLTRTPPGPGPLQQLLPTHSFAVSTWEIGSYHFFILLAIISLLLRKLGY